MEFLGNKYLLKKGNLKMCFERKTAGLILSFVVLMFFSRITFAQQAQNLKAEIGKDRPQISLENSSFDFGLVSRKQGSVKKNILISNKGNQDLIVKDIKASCSCTTAALKADKNVSPYFGPAGAGPGWQMVIEPGKLAELEIIFDAANPAVKEGKVKRNISIVSNDPVFSIIEVKFEVQLSE